MKNMESHSYGRTPGWLGGWRWWLGLLWVIKAIAAPDFTLTVEPSSLTLVPGRQSSLLISTTPLDGFSNQVTLATGPLPSGISAKFSSKSLQPPGASVLTLTAATNAAIGSFSLSVVAVGGGITNTASSGVIVNFGLIKLCTGAFTGSVTDKETGLPITNATVRTYYFNRAVDAQGTYLLDAIPLGDDNSPLAYSVQAFAVGYFPSPSVYSYAICQVTNTVDLQLLRQRSGSVSGTVTISGAGPAEGARVSLSGIGGATTFADASGHYQVAQLALSNGNLPTYYSMVVDTNHYWNVYTNVTVAADSNAVVDIQLLRVCGATVSGQVLLADTLQPATNTRVSIYGGHGQVSVTTDTQGNYFFPDVTLGENNTVLKTSVAASFPGYYSGNTNILLSSCGESVSAPVLYLNPYPRNNYGVIAGHVYDVDSGLPLAGATIDYGGAETDSTGAYLYTNILVGTGTATNSSRTVQASAPGYFLNSSNIIVTAGVTNALDIYLLKFGFGGVAGVVHDSATTLPLTNVSLSIYGVGSIVTDSQGHYFSGPVRLNPGNQPVQVDVYANHNGYYPLHLSTIVTNGVTNLLNLDLIKICSGATIVGNVVDAASQQPITNATISINSGLTATTDPGGNFILTNITVGNNNSPIQTTVYARAPGYNPQSRAVTIFCGATITTEFGAPQTAVAGIVGFVTNTVTGLPLAGVFIGSQFGEATTTDTNGFYTLSHAPLGANNSRRTWTVTAIPDGFAGKTLSVTVSSNSISQLNFGFGEPPTRLQLTETSDPASVTVGSNVVYTLTLNNSGADAEDVRWTDTLGPGVTFVSASFMGESGGSFSTPLFTNGIITTSATNLASQQTVVLKVIARPSMIGPFTNQVTVTSSTSDVDPTGTNRVASVVNTATAPVPTNADLQVNLSAAPTSALVGDTVAYTFVVTNAGPADAAGARLDAMFATSEPIVTSEASQGSVTRTGPSLHWELGSLENGGVARLVVMATPQSPEILTNAATVSLVPGDLLVVDPNPANNRATVLLPVHLPTPTTTDLVIEAGAVVFDPQTGLYEQQVQVMNPTSQAIPGLWLLVSGLPSDVILYNGQGKTNGVPYVTYETPLDAGASVALNLEYFNSKRQPFVSTHFSVIPGETPSHGTPSGPLLALDRNPTMVNGHLVIEFQAVPGATYVVQYSSDLETWKTAQPPIVAPVDRVQWIDSGPPKTDSQPTDVGSRFYRVVQTSGAATSHP